MRAKMMYDKKTPETGVYQCERCNHRFKSSGNQLRCHTCGNLDTNGLVVIYMEDDPEQDLMYSAIDWHGGD